VRQVGQVAVDYDAVEAVVFKKQQAAKQLCERFHRAGHMIIASGGVVVLYGTQDTVRFALKKQAT
jgi:hypothetical protein